MASFGGQIVAAQGTYTVSGPNGVGTDGVIFGGCTIPPTMSVGVGSPYSISAQINSGSPFSNITKLVFSFPTFHLISAVNPDTGANNSFCTLAHCYADDIGTSWTWVPTHPASGYTVKFFASIDVGTDTLSVSAYFDGSPNEETVTFKMTFAAPTMSLNFVAPSGSNQFSFGPSQWSHTSGGQVVYDNTVITSWQDTNYKSGVVGTQYNFGACSYPLTPWQYSGNATNATSSNGAFYIIQLGIIHDPTFYQWYDTNRYSDGTYTVPHSTVDGANNPIPCLDKQLAQLGPSPFLWSWSSIQQIGTGNSGPYPAANTEINDNGVLINYYFDRPKFGWTDVGKTRSDGSSNFDVYYSLHFNVDFTTWAVYQSYDPDNEASIGLPVGIKYQNWSLNTAVDNATAKQTLDWRDGRTNSAIWAGNSLPMQTVGTSGAGPSWVVWPDDLGNFVNKASATYKIHSVPFFGAGSNTGSMGRSTIGGGSAQQSPYGQYYPKSSVASFVSFGGGGMN